MMGYAVMWIVTRWCLNKLIWIVTYIHTTHALSPKGFQRHLEYSSQTLHFERLETEILVKLPKLLALSNTTDVIGGKPITVWSQSISGVNDINLIVAFYDIHGRKKKKERGAILLFWDHTRL
jgi:hypothetical protein